MINDPTDPTGLQHRLEMTDGFYDYLSSDST